jgi:ubiquinone/menaquinone biosynthesis C-methylase UbiE
MDNERNRVCPVELANSLDSNIRKWLQNPRKILSPFIKEGMTVLDIGCGPGFFSIEMAAMVGSSGKVIAVDLQEGMLQKLGNKIRGTELEERIVLVHCAKDTLRLPEKIDFGLAFYMVHEIPDKDRFFGEVRAALKDTGQFLLVEPKYVHVSKQDFAATIVIAQKAGFAIHEGPRLPVCRTAILKGA